MRRRDRAVLFAHVFGAGRVILAVLVVAIMFGALLPLKTHQINVSLSEIDLIGVALLVDGQMGKSDAKFTQSFRGIFKAVVIDSRSPYKEAFFALPIVDDQFLRHQNIDP
jgi:hypothetical protein